MGADNHVRRKIVNAAGEFFRAEVVDQIDQLESARPVALPVVLREGVEQAVKLLGMLG